MQATLRPARLPEDTAELTALVGEYLTWALGRLYEEFGQVMEMPTPEQTAASLPAFDRPGARLIVVEVEGRPAGLGALRTLEAGVAEVKRMYVRPYLRGCGLGTALLDRLLADARDVLGAGVVRLDSCRFMHDAHRLYEHRGFVEREPYDGSEIPGELRRYWKFYERGLSGAPR